MIADDIIISAAHCFDYIDGAEIGRHDVTDNSESFEVYNIEKSLKHPSYKDAAGSFDNDFMLMKLWGWSPGRQVVKINANKAIPAYDNEQLHVMGWGVSNTATQETAPKLKEVSVDYMTNDGKPSFEESYRAYHLF